MLKELRLRGYMLEHQATNFHLKRTGVRRIGLLNELWNNTNLVYKVIGDQYRINPEMQVALDAVFDEAER